MVKLKEFTIEDIRALKPCYDPSRHLSEDWRGNAVDIAVNEDIPFKHVVWVLASGRFVDDDTLRRFAAWNAAEALLRTKWNDAKSLEPLKAIAKDNHSVKEIIATRNAARRAEGATRKLKDNAACISAKCAADSAEDSAALAVILTSWCVTKSAASVKRQKLIQFLRGEATFTMKDVEKLERDLDCTLI